MANADITCVQNHSAYIYDRGGRRPVGPLLSLSRVRWSRVRDNTSEAMVRFEKGACDENADTMSRTSTHRSELVIFRGGARVWEGPVHRIASQDETYTEIYAKDVSQYLFAQPLTQRYSNATEDGVSHVDTVTGRIEKIIEYEFAHGRVQFAADTPTNLALKPGLEAQGYVFTPVAGGWNVAIPAWEALDPPLDILPFLDVRHFPNEAETAMVTEAYETSVGQHLQSLARQRGIDFTTVGRSIVIWDVSRSTGKLPTLTTENFTARVVVTEYGADHTQAAYVIGQDDAVGQALNLDGLAHYGPWTQMYTVYNEEGSDAPTQPQLDSQASRNLAGRSPAPIEVRVPDNSSIILSEAITINSLVPGAQVPLRAVVNGRDISQPQKIDIVTVEETAEREDIRVTLTPATKPDTDEEEE